MVHLFITNRLEQNPPIIIGRYPDGPNKIIRITQRPITAAIIHFIRQGQLFSIFVQMLRAKFFAEFSVFFVRENIAYGAVGVFFGISSICMLRIVGAAPRYFENVDKAKYERNDISFHPTVTPI